MSATRTWRYRTYVQLEPSARTRRGLSLANKVLCAAIILSSLAAILETEPLVVVGQQRLFFGLELLFTITFAIEYGLRVWASAEDPRCGPGLRGRLRYVRTPAAVLDLLAIAPILLTLGGSEAFLLRAFRLIRILRLARLGRFSSAMKHIGTAIRSRRHELLLSFAIAFLLLIVTSTLMFLAEGPAQPQAFGSIPRSMWWSIATLTTVGYGDVYPVTAIGRVLAAITAVTGIGLIAMPTGILAAAFSDALQRQQATREEVRKAE